MDMRVFNQTWEIEYLCTRVKRITESVESGRYEQALDYLRTIQDKARAAENLIRKKPEGGWEIEAKRGGINGTVRIGRKYITFCVGGTEEPVAEINKRQGGQYFVNGGLWSSQHADRKMAVIDGLRKAGYKLYLE